MLKAYGGMPSYQQLQAAQLAHYHMYGPPRPHGMEPDGGYGRGDRGHGHKGGPGRGGRGGRDGGRGSNSRQLQDEYQVCPHALLCPRAPRPFKLRARSLSPALSFRLPLLSFSLQM